MARYIDAELVLDELKEELEFDTPFYTQEQNQYVTRGIKIAIMDINRTPTADVVKVVRCKDCLSWKECGIDPITNYHFGYCRHYQWQDKDDSRETNAQDFCSYGWGGDESDA